MGIIKQKKGKMNNEINNRISEILREEFDIEGINVEGYDSIEAVFDEASSHVDEDDAERCEFYKEVFKTVESLYLRREDEDTEKTHQNENLVLYKKEIDGEEVFFVYSKKTDCITDVAVYDLYSVVVTPYGVAFSGEDKLLFVDIDNNSYSDLN